MRHFADTAGTVYRFDPSTQAHLISMAEARGWTDLGENYPPPGQVDLRGYAAARRYEVETGGITVGDRKIDTSRGSQAMIASAVAYLDAGATEVEFKSVDGWVTLSAEAMRAIGLAVAQHVQACFSAERVVDAAIAAGTVTTTEQIDAWSWPAGKIDED